MRRPGKRVPGTNEQPISGGRIIDALISLLAGGEAAVVALLRSPSWCLEGVPEERTKTFDRIIRQIPISIRKHTCMDTKRIRIRAHHGDFCNGV